MSRPSAPKANTVETAKVPMGLIAVVTVVLVALVAIIVYLSTRGDGLEAQEGTNALPQEGTNALPQGGGLVVNPGAEGVPEVHLYEDFQCPFCGELEQVSGEAISEAAAGGDIKLTYTFMSFLDQSLGNDSSTRAANAAVCSADSAKLSSFVQGVFAQQPEQEGDGYSDQILLDVAKNVGLEGEALDTFTACVKDQKYGDYVADMQERATKDEVTSSPVVKIDGETISQEALSMLLQDPTSFNALVADQK